jgi:hypothetical protein
VKFDLITPCKDCPFRTDVAPYLTAERVYEIGDACERRQETFACHKTVEYDDEGEPVRTQKEQHCAGALIMLERLETPNQMMRIAERFGAYDRTKLRMDAPVFEDFEEMAEAQPR